MQDITPDGLRSLAGAGQSKYHAKRTYVPALDRTFASKHEATVAVGLALRQELGEIRDLQYQQPFDVWMNARKVCRYVADFTFWERTADGGERFVVADAKGYPTPVYRLKKRLLSIALEIDVVEL